MKVKNIRTPFFVLAVLLLASGVSLFGESKSPRNAQEKRSGEYVVYRDYTWKNPTWIGFLYYDDSTYGAFVITPETGSNVNVLFRVETNDGKMILTGQNIISKITQNDVLAVNYLMALLPDLESWRLAALSSTSALPLKKGAQQAGVTRSLLLPPVTLYPLMRQDFGGDVILSYAPEVPLFNLLSMATPEKKPVLELVRMGRVQSGDDASFFNFTPVPVAKKETPVVLSISRKTENRTIDGIKVTLDDQWTMIADNTFFLGDSAALLVDTIDLALMDIDQNSLPLSLVKNFSLSNKSSWSIPSQFALSGNAKRFRIENLFYDSTTGMMNRDIKICIPVAGRKCTIISLSVVDTAYQANRAYFDSLF